jgi:hypothetical protein
MIDPSDPYYFSALFREDKTKESSPGQDAGVCTVNTQNLCTPMHILACENRSRACEICHGADGPAGISGSAQKSAAPETIFNKVAQQQAAQEHVVVHVRAGEEFRVFVRLVHKAATGAQTKDESLQRLSPEEAPYRYIIIRAGKQTPQNGFCNMMAPGMIVRKVCITKPAVYKMQMHPANASMKRSMCDNTGFMDVH